MIILFFTRIYVIYIYSLFKRCGPGTWLLDLSNNYEDSNFFGLDIKPIFPQEVNEDKKKKLTLFSL